MSYRSHIRGGFDPNAEQRLQASRSGPTSPWRMNRNVSAAQFRDSRFNEDEIGALHEGAESIVMEAEDNLARIEPSRDWPASSDTINEMRSVAEGKLGRARQLEQRRYNY